MPPFTLADTSFPMAWMAAALTLDVLSVALLGGWLVALRRVVRELSAVPNARAGLHLPEATGVSPSVCVVVPVHNEEGTIAGLIRSLRAQDYPHLRVVLSLDRCTDATAHAAHGAVEGDPRFTIVEVGSCPKGWAGKVNAVVEAMRCRGIQNAELLLFIDADTVLDPACVRACVALLLHRKLDLLSLLTTLTGEAWYEKIVQPVAGFELVRQYPLHRVNRRTNPRAFANGQFMLFRRAAYDAAGGHRAVHDELLEDMALARRIAEGGGALGLFDARGLLRCRMYDSWPAFREGWKRIYIEAARRKAGRLRRSAAIMWIGGVVLPVAGLVNGGASMAMLASVAGASGWGVAGLVLSGAGLGVAMAVLLASYRTARLPLGRALAYPIGAWLVGGILAEAARDLTRRVPVTWGGRQYVREPR